MLSPEPDLAFAKGCELLDAPPELGESSKANAGTATPEIARRPDS
jgi:hypothetical protein